MLEISDNFLIHHFYSHTLSTLGSPIVQLVVEDSMATVHEVDHLKHALLAVSAAHISSLLGAHSRKKDEYYHTQKAIVAFREQIGQPIIPSRTDPLLLTSVLLNTKAFWSEPYDPSKSWLFSAQPDLQWLTIQAGFKSLLGEFRRFLGQSLFARAYKTGSGAISRDHPTPLSDTESGSIDIPAYFLEVFAIKEDSTPQNNPYLAPIEFLLPQLGTDSSQVHPAKVMAFTHRIGPDFYCLMKAKDLRALLILAYWTGLLCRVDLWWIHNRARSECVALCTYLEVYGDARIRRLLQYPAKCCGYSLQDQGLHFQKELWEV